MKIAFHTHSTRGHWQGPAPTPTEQEWLFSRVSEQGYEGLDISDSWPFEALDKAHASQTRQLAAAHGLAIPTVSCMGKTLCHAELGAQNLQALERALDTACWLGARVLNIALSTPRSPGIHPVMGATRSPGGSREASDDDFEITAQRLRKVARLAQPRGIDLSIEMHDRSLADTSITLLRILDEVNEPNIGANPDLCNGYRAYSAPSEPWVDALRRLAPRTVLWHVNNLQRIYFPEIERAAFIERPLGEGDIDYSLAVKHMKTTDFKGWVVIEYKGSGDAFETLAQSQRYLKKLLETGHRHS